MASTDRTVTGKPLNCKECKEPVRKTATGTYVCTGCGRTSTPDSVE